MVFFTLLLFTFDYLFLFSSWFLLILSSFWAHNPVSYTHLSILFMLSRCKMIISIPLENTLFILGLLCTIVARCVLFIAHHSTHCYMKIHHVPVSTKRSPSIVFLFRFSCRHDNVVFVMVSQPNPDYLIGYIKPRQILLEFVILKAILIYKYLPCTITRYD